MKCQSLKDYIDEARDLSDKHTDLKQVLTHIDRIFSVPESVTYLTAQMKEEDGNMLEVHHRIAEIEACRNDLFTMMFSLEERSERESEKESTLTQPIETYFADIHVLSTQLQQ
jgi:hypothetical protein